MANTPKKKNAGSSAKSGSKRRSAPPPPAYNAQARIIGGIVCLLLALCVLVTYFNVDAILLTFLANVLKGCVGYGYWLAAPALLYAGIVLVGHKGRPVKLRTTCTLLLPEREVVLVASLSASRCFCRRSCVISGCVSVAGMVTVSPVSCPDPSASGAG